MPSTVSAVIVGETVGFAPVATIHTLFLLLAGILAVLVFMAVTGGR